ncbi:MAG: hypothetical protein ACI861_001728, partial [Paracoccaceae bacterium]
CGLSGNESPSERCRALEQAHPLSKHSFHTLFKSLGRLAHSYRGSFYQIKSLDLTAY